MPGLAEDIDREKAHRVSLMVLCGLAAGGAGDLPSLPLRESASRDERLVARITSILGFDEAQYAELQDEIWDLTSRLHSEEPSSRSESLFQRFRVIGRQGIAIVEWAAETAETEAERDLELGAA